jgi:ArsR family transcriptional regulator, arsenate/arsenite/antimonite-responsive transcriptional repressor
VFKALGDATRLKIFEFLCSCCCAVAVDEAGDVSPTDGPTVGDVCCHVLGSEKITSSLSFHLKELRSAGLITMDRRGRHFVCQVNQAALSEMAGYWAERQNLCCSGPKEKTNEL